MEQFEAVPDSTETIQAELETLAIRLANIDLEFFEATIRHFQMVAQKMRVERAITRHSSLTHK